jgi:thiol-disulfide isomerase/thioredoxin
MFLFLLSCSGESDMNGNWKLDIKLQGESLPVVMKIQQKEKKLTGYIVNSSETLNITGMISENTFHLDFQTGYAQIVGKLIDNKIEGEWIRTNKEDYSVKFSGNKTSYDGLYKKYERSPSLMNLAGKWKVELEKDKFGLGVFSQKGSRVQGSILTTTGDYRFLDGYLKNNELKLTGFDGVFSFIINLVVKEGKLKGMMYSGKSYAREISAIRDESFDLEDATLITKSLSEKPIGLKVKTLSGALIDLSKGDYQGKAKVIQIFGSWCPNCIDETHFFLKWRKENQAKLNEVKFFGPLI